ncbi:hypothetical protein QE373_003187 [Stenotrophomonas sp. SORGH_AS321]|nr:hypothetical protein [Stenotrophomonas sp. SORGH_AS_0321]
MKRPAFQPADAVIRRQRLGEPRAHHHPAVAVEGLQQGLQRFTVLQFGVHDVFDDRQSACLRHLSQALLGRNRHGATQGVVHRRHDHQRGQRSGVQQGIECFHVQPMLGVGGQFDGLQAEAGEQRIKVEIGRRFEPDGVAGFGYRTQGQLQGFHRTVGQHDPFGRGMQAHPRSTPYDLPDQRL